MKKTTVVVLALAVLLGIYWFRPSRLETRALEQSSRSPRVAAPGATPPAASAAVANPSVTPSPPSLPPTKTAPAQSSVAGKIAAISAFERRARTKSASNQERERGLNALKKSELKSIGNGGYQAVTAVAVPAPRYTASMGEPLLAVNGFKVVAGETEGWQTLTFHEQARPVVMNASGRLGVVTGTVIVKAHDLAAARAYANRMGLKELLSDESISTLYLRPAEGVALVDLRSALAQKSALFERVDLEIMDSVKEAK